MKPEEIFSVPYMTKVKDVVTGFEGVIIARTEYMNGCRQLLVKPQRLNKDTGEQFDGSWIDITQLDIVKKAEKQEYRAAGGPQSQQPSQQSNKY